MMWFKIILVPVLLLLPLRHAVALDDNLKSVTMPNGMELIMMEDHKVPLATLVLTIKAGAMTETVDINGLTHLWEHMFFKGNKRLPSQEAFKKRIKQLGIVYNGDTGAEKVRYYFTLPSAKLDEGIQFMADAISTPLLDQKEIEREIQVVLNEYDHNASKPGFDYVNLFRNILYGDQQHRRDPLGSRVTITNTTKEQLLRIKDEVMVPANSALIIGGDFDPAKVEKMVAKHFAGWQTPREWKFPEQPKFPPFPASYEFVMTRPELKSADFSMLYEGPTVGADPQATYEADILSGLLSHLNGKFYKKFVDSGLCYSAHFTYQTTAKVGSLDVDTSMPPKNLKTVQKMLRDEIKLWASSDYFTPAQLADVHRQLKIRHILERATPSEYTKSLAFWWSVTGLSYYDNYIENMEKVGLADIQRFVIKWLVDKPHVDGTLLSPEGAKVAGVKDSSEALVKKYLSSYYPTKYGKN